MKKFLLLLGIVSTLTLGAYQILPEQISIGVAKPDASASLHLTGVTKGFVANKVTTAQRNAIPSPVEGLMIYNTSASEYQYYDGATWNSIGSGGGGGASIETWLTATSYAVDDLVIHNDILYQCENNHTSGTFSTDYANGEWVKIPVSVDLAADVTGTLPVANGGTNLSSVPANGQLLIGDGVDYTLSTITGTANQVNVANGIGSITLSLPQSIATSSNVQFANLTATGTTTLATSLTGPLKASSGVVSAAAINLASSEVTGVLPIANGGTGSATQNFVDLTNTQSVAGEKTFSTGIKADSVQTTGSSGVVFKNSGGTQVADFGPANTTNSSFSGGLNVAGAFAANGGATLGDASGDSLTINSNAASIPNNLNFDSNTLFVDSANNSVAIGAASVTTSAALDVVSTSKAFLPPRMTSAQRDAIASPAAGMVVYNTTNNTLDFYNGTIWASQFASSDYDWTDYTPTITGAGTVSPASNMCKHRRQGSMLQVQCFFTTGTTTATLFSLTLPSGLNIDTTKIRASNTTSGQGQHIGFSFQNGNAGSTQLIVTATGTATDKIYQGANFTGVAALTPANGSSTFFNSQPTTLSFEVPISGWTNSGGLNDVVSTPGAGAVKMYAVRVSDNSGTVGSDIGDLVNGNTSLASNDFTYTFNSGKFTGTPICVASCDRADETCWATAGSASSSGVIVSTYNTGGLAARSHTLYCFGN